MQDSVKFWGPQRAKHLNESQPRELFRTAPDQPLAEIIQVVHSACDTQTFSETHKARYAVMQRD